MTFGRPPLKTQVGSKLEDMIPTMKAGRHIKESFKVRGAWATTFSVTNMKPILEG